MIKFPNRAGRLALCAMLAATATLSATKSFAAPRYDGTWSVLVVTEKGTCDPAYRYPIRISNGSLLNAGALTVTISAGGKSATGSGRLSGDMGIGSWTGGACSGSWTAERRAAPEL
jgi:hypothetical protein